MIKCSYWGTEAPDACRYAGRPPPLAYSSFTVGPCLLRQVTGVAGVCTLAQAVTRVCLASAPALCKSAAIPTLNPFPVCLHVPPGPSTHFLQTASTQAEMQLPVVLGLKLVPCA